MSTVITSKLKGVVENNYNILVSGATHTSYPGTIIQVQTIRSDAKLTYASATTGDGTTISAVGLSITPKYSNSMLLMRWQLCGELYENNVFLLHRDGVLITDSGYAGYNATAGNNRWSGFVPPYYDGDQNSTPAAYKIQYFIPAGSTSSRTYAPAVRAARSTAYTFYLNRTQGSTGADNYEQTVSTGIIMEIAA